MPRSGHKSRFPEIKPCTDRYDQNESCHPPFAKPPWGTGRHANAFLLATMLSHPSTSHPPFPQLPCASPMLPRRSSGPVAAIRCPMPSRGRTRHLIFRIDSTHLSSHLGSHLSSNLTTSHRGSCTLQEMLGPTTLPGFRHSSRGRGRSSMSPIAIPQGTRATFASCCVRSSPAYRAHHQTITPSPHHQGGASTAGTTQRAIAVQQRCRSRLRRCPLRIALEVPILKPSQLGPAQCRWHPYVTVTTEPPNRPTQESDQSCDYQVGASFVTIQDHPRSSNSFQQLPSQWAGKIGRV